VKPAVGRVVARREAITTAKALAGSSTGTIELQRVDGGGMVVDAVRGGRDGDIARRASVRRSK